MVAGPSSWNALPVGLSSSSFGLDTFAKHLNTSLWFSVLTTGHTLLSLYYFVECDTVTVSPNQIIIIFMSDCYIGI